MSTPRLAIRGLRIATRGKRLVDDLSLSVHDGQTVAVVGESGSGKSLTALSILGLTPPGVCVDAGRILWRRDDQQTVDVRELASRDLRKFRGGSAAMIFQEPMTSLNPVMTVGEQLVEALSLHRDLAGDETRRTAVAALADVGIREPDHRFHSYPHELSGGMRQRVMIAMALACHPRLLIADEPTTALDVTVASQILSMIDEIKCKRGLGVLLITHDMGVVAQNADVVCVMYAGRIVEYADVRTLFTDPIHPYTRGLLACVPRLGDRKPRLSTLAEYLQADTVLHSSLAERGLRPWWPTSGGDSVLVDLGNRYVRIAADQARSAAAATDPDLAFVRAAREDAPRCAS